MIPESTVVIGQGLLWGWALIAALAVGAVTALIAWWRVRRRRGREADVVLVANTAFVAQLPQVRSAWRRYRVYTTVALCALVGATIAAGVLTARPHDATQTSPRSASRDIVLCLDASGSMIEYDIEILDLFNRLVKNFAGERVALVVWNSQAYTVFPLTDDYAMMADELTDMRSAFQSYSATFGFGALTPDSPALGSLLRLAAGTDADRSRGTSLIGDGLASCALSFDLTETQRSRSIILATDNQLAGEPFYTLDQASDLAASREIRVYGIDPARDSSGGYRQAVERIGGLYLDVDDPDTVATLVDDVLAQQAVELDSAAPIVVIDTPAAAFSWLLAGLGCYFVAAWRVRK